MLGALWLAEDRVLISYPAKARVFLKRMEVDGVSVGYNPEQ
jgi:hypothetical protein